MATLGLYFSVSSCNQHSLLKAHLCSYPSLDLPMGLSSLVPMVISAPISLPVPVSLRLYNREHHKVGCPGWAGTSYCLSACAVQGAAAQNIKISLRFISSSSRSFEIPTIRGRKLL